MTTFLVFLSALQTFAQDASLDQRLPCGIWVVRNALQSSAARAEAMDQAERLGCRRLYLQVSGRWDAWFPSAVFPAPATPPEEADPLAGAIEEARARGLEVHAWVNALLAWSAPEPPPDPAHVFRSHPDWFVTDGRGRSMRRVSRAELDRSGLEGEGWFLDPARPEVRTELRRFVLELATRYPVDGIHLDYIRYPSGWKPAGGEAEVTRLVALLRADLQEARPGIVLSAAVMPRPDQARVTFGQDWEAWLALGIVDDVLPMVYRDTPGAVLEVVEGYPAAVERRRVWVGLRVDRLTPAEYRTLAGRLADLGAGGAALFSHNLIAETPAWRRAGD